VAFVVPNQQASKTQCDTASTGRPIEHQAACLQLGHVRAYGGGQPCPRIARSTRLDAWPGHLPGPTLAGLPGITPRPEPWGEGIGSSRPPADRWPINPNLCRPHGAAGTTPSGVPAGARSRAISGGATTSSNGWNVAAGRPCVGGLLPQPSARADPVGAVPCGGKVAPLQAAGCFRQHKRPD
jgi:hypothetical protein